MDLLIGWTPYETKFNGEQVTMELCPLKVSEYRALSRFMRRLDDPIDAALNTMDMLGICKPIFEQRVRNIQGLTINGAPVTSEHLSEESAMILLAQDIAQELFMRSTVLPGKEKNSEGQSGSSTT